MISNHEDKLILTEAKNGCFSVKFINTVFNWPSVIPFQVHLERLVKDGFFA